MKNQIVCFTAQLKRNSLLPSNFSFNETQVRALMAGLSSVYSEVLIWRCKNHVGVWVVGGNPQLLFHAFEHFSSHYVDWKLMEGDIAEYFFFEIINGRQWCSINEKYKNKTLSESRAIAMEDDSLGLQLNEMIDAGTIALEYRSNEEVNKREQILLVNHRGMTDVKPTGKDFVQLFHPFGNN